MSYEKTLNLIYSNELIMEELKKLFDEEAERHAPRMTGQDDEMLGQEYRAYMKAKEIIEDTFIQIKMLKRNETSTSGLNYK